MTDYAAERHPGRCPTPSRRVAERGDPGDRQKQGARSRRCSAFRASIFTTSSSERKPVSPAVAVRLGKLFGDGAGVWVRMQGAHDTWHAERDLRAEIKKIPRLKPRAA